jgi:uncharacterized integral membrane protein (TIGR00697 family)
MSENNSNYPPLHLDEDREVVFNRKANFLFMALSTFFIASALIAEFVGVKVFSVEKSLGLSANVQLLGMNLPSLNLTTGALLWPIVFIMSDIINEYFGTRGVRILSYITAVLISYAFLIIFFAMALTPADFWIMRQSPGGPVNMEVAFEQIFGQGMWIIVGSLVAFIVGQVVDVTIFHHIKRLTGERHLWLRATGSTLVSQLIDTYIVLIIAFHINPQTHWDLGLIFAIGTTKYVYKFIMAIGLTPLIYIVHIIIDEYLGEETATRIKQCAMQDKRTFI